MSQTHDSTSETATERQCTVPFSPLINFPIDKSALFAKVSYTARNTRRRRVKGLINFPFTEPRSTLLLSSREEQRSTSFTNHPPTVRDILAVNLPRRFTARFAGEPRRIRATVPFAGRSYPGNCRKYRCGSFTSRPAVAKAGDAGRHRAGNGTINYGGSSARSRGDSRRGRPLCACVTNRGTCGLRRLTSRCWREEL